MLDRTVYQSLKELLTERAASSFTAIVAVNTTTTEVAGNSHAQGPLTRTTHAMSTTQGLDLTSYLAKLCLQVGRTGGVRVPARARNRESKELEGKGGERAA
jgi:hypothetical protein